MTLRISTILILAILPVAGSSCASAQELYAVPERERKNPVASSIFTDLQSGILAGDVAAFSDRLAKQVYLNLSDRESGFFSQNQALYILKDYFKTHRILSFKFTTISQVEGTPFATGGGTYLRRGNPEILQVYVALKKSGDGWVISQFSVF
ncbi:MAG TPA: DUF4783 domain-containing protein [Bacteroidota bacterium]|jgi:hypothetical protein